MSRVTSFVSSLAGILLVAGPLHGQSAEPPDEVSAALEARVAGAVAAVWRTEPSSLQLEWGLLREDATLPDDAPFRVVGRGTDGWFAVVFERAGQPVATRVRAGVVDTVVVAARPLTRGMELSAADISLEVRPMWGPPRDDNEELPGVGWKVRRAIAAGSTVEAPAVSRPYVVAAGELVLFVWRRGAVKITVGGVALNAARVGDRVRARADGRSGSISGIVTEPGMARLTGGH
jgi:flagella basal body P-ring formation protein FlgA